MEAYMKLKQKDIQPPKNPETEPSPEDIKEESKKSTEKTSPSLDSEESPPKLESMENSKTSKEMVDNKNKAKKMRIIPEKETHIKEKFKSYFQSPTLNRAFGDFMSVNLKSLRDEKNLEVLPLAEIKPFVMGMCGGTSAGKSQIVKMIVKSLNKRKNTDKVTFLSEENFFKSKQQDQEERDIDFDHPSNIDWEMFSAALNALINREKFEIPLFDMKSENRKKEKKLLEPSDLIIVEGRMVFYDEIIRSKCDLKIFLDTDEDIRLSRRVYKDVLVRKKKVEDVIDRYLKFVKPDFEKYVLPSKKYADIIIPNYGGGFSNEMPETEVDHDDIGFNHFDHAAVGLIIDQVYKKVKKIKEVRLNCKT